MPQPPTSAEIMAVGSELLTPFRLDTNSLYLTEQLNRLGIAVRCKIVAGDDRAQLAGLMRESLRRAGVVVITGGLGPTEDDLTREAAADALGIRLLRDAQIEEGLRRFFSRRTIAMPARNLKQADVLEGAEVIPNANGTAPGQFYHSGSDLLVLLPGPPRELKPMFEGWVMPRLRSLTGERGLCTRVLKIADRPESQVDEIAAPIYTAHPDVETTILATQPGEIELHFRASGDTATQARVAADALAQKVAAALAEAVFSLDGESLECVVGKLLRASSQTLSVAESCTAGMIAKRLTDVPGSSDYFAGGVVCYDNRLKHELVGVRADTLSRFGAVSPEVARELAQGIRQRCGTDWGVSVTGIAGPSGGSEDKPVGLVYIGIADADRTEVIQRRFPGDRDRIRKFSAQVALDQLRLALLASEVAKQGVARKVIRNAAER